MKVFVSYRRTDTGGRAGRLFDTLAAEYGARNVFHDVTSATPGSDFVAALDGAIEESDVVLVVIGPRWLGVDDEGNRRIDRHDDFVRTEVGIALAADQRVVPVLVDGAELPSEADLPIELAGLVRRQAVPVRDETWHQDVRALIRRLEGELIAPQGPRRRWPIVVGVAAVAVVAVVAVVALSRDGGEGEDLEAGDTPTCPSPDDSWTAFDVPPSDDAVLREAGIELGARVVGGWARSPSAGSPTVLVELEVTNRTPPIPGGDDEIYIGTGVVEGLVVDGYEQEGAVCISTTTDPQLAPDRRTVATVGFDSTVDPVGAAVVLEMFADVELVVAEGPAG